MWNQQCRKEFATQYYFIALIAFDTYKTDKPWKGLLHRFLNSPKNKNI